jgi:hypothetical protein
LSPPPPPRILSCGRLAHELGPGKKCGARTGE